MDAILKAFEKMEKREERRKEALARIGGSGAIRKSRDSKSIDESPTKMEPVQVSGIL